MIFVLRLYDSMHPFIFCFYIIKCSYLYLLCDFSFSIFLVFIKKFSLITW